MYWLNTHTYTLTQNTKLLNLVKISHNTCDNILSISCYKCSKCTCSTPLLWGLESGTIARIAIMSTFEINLYFYRVLYEKQKELNIRTVLTEHKNLNTLSVVEKKR